MDFSQNLSMEEAFALAEAEAKLNAALQAARQRFNDAKIPDRYNEDWRFGQPAKHAVALAEILETSAPARGSISVKCADSEVVMPVSAEDDELKETVNLMPTIGSDALLGLHIRRFGEGICLMLEENTEIKQPIIITYETDGLYTPYTFIMAAPGAKARIEEHHKCADGATMFCVRNIHVMEGAQIAVELHEHGSIDSRCMNITDIHNLGGAVQHFTSHAGHAWAREETIAEVYAASPGTSIELYSANRISGNSVLDQHTHQIHHIGGAKSNLLYKNVVDENGTAIFAGNIRVEAGAHCTDAYQTNRNLLLSEKSTVHSLPGLEILADKVRCSHGSASSPVDEEALFYLTSRGVSRANAQELISTGFLEDAYNKFRKSFDENYTSGLPD